MQLVSLLFHDVYRRSPGESGFSSPGADRYKLTDCEWSSQLDGVAEARRDRPVLASALADRTSTGELPFLITVDDGGVSYHEVMADRLEKRGWRGHAFVTTLFSS